MNADPLQIQARVDALLTELAHFDTDTAGTETADPGITEIADIDAVGRRLEEAHQILVEALESVEKG